MKTIYSIFSLLFLVVATANAQRGVAISESFEGAFPPDNWVNFHDGGGTKEWTQADNSSGWPVTGSFCALAAYDDGVFGNSAWLVTPAISSASQLTFYACDSFDPTDFLSTLSVKVSSTDQTTIGSFTNLLTITEAEAGHGVMTQYTVDLSAYSGSPVYVAFVMYDDDNDGESWFIDDVLITSVSSHDIGVTAISPPFLLPGETIIPQVTVTSYSDVTETNFEVSLSDGNGYTSSVTVTEPLVASESIVLDMDNWTPAESEYTLTATVTLTNDPALDNNTLVTECLVGGYNDATYAMKTTDFTYGTVNLGDGEYTQIATAWEVPTIRSEEYNGEYIYRIDDNNNIYTVGPNGVHSKQGTITGVIGTIHGLTWDWVNNEMYMMALDESDISRLYTLDMETFEGTQAGTFILAVVPYIEMANDGYLYGFEFGTGNKKMVRIDKSTAQVTEIGDSGENFNTTAMAYDSDINGIYSYNMDGSGNSTFGIFNIQTAEFISIATITGYEYKTLVITKDATPVSVNKATTNKICVYPNPSEGTFSIVNSELQILNIQITDITGKILKNEEINIKNFQFVISKKGVYFIKVETGDEIFTKKLIIN